MASQEWTELRAEPDPGELLDQVVLLVRQAGGGEDADRLRPSGGSITPFSPSAATCERVLPGGRVELAVLAADERLGQAVRVVDEVEGEAALDAEVALVRDVLRLRGDLDDPLRLGVDVEVDLAADAAERAGRLRLLELPLLDARRPRGTSRRSRRSGRRRGSRRRARTRCRARSAPRSGRSAPPARGPRARAPSTASPPACSGRSGCRGCTCRARSPSAGCGPRTGSRFASGRTSGASAPSSRGEVDELVRPAAGVGVQVLGEQHLGQRLPELRHLSSSWRRPSPR